jgi:hypothetical protein
MERVTGIVSVVAGVSRALGEREGTRRARLMAAAGKASLRRSALYVMSSKKDRAGRMAREKRSMGKGRGDAPGKGVREIAAHEKAIERRLEVGRSERRARGEMEWRLPERKRSSKRAESMDSPPG